MQSVSPAAPHKPGPASSSPTGTNRRIIVVEDESLLVMLLEAMLADLGYQLVGTAMTIQDAEILATNEKFDIAILDANLHGVPIEPVANRIRSRGLPIVFATGYDAQKLQERFGDCLAVQKPYEMRELGNALRAAAQEVGEFPPSNPAEWTDQHSTVSQTSFRVRSRFRSERNFAISYGP